MGVYLYCTRVLYDFGDKKWTQRVSHTKMVIFKRCLLAIITFEKSRDFFRYDSIIQSNMEIHILEHQVTKNMPGILNAKVLR